MKLMDRETIQLPYLETFSKAAELCSFTATAKELGLTQAAVSQRIQTLERMLDKPLFKRQGGRVLLTESGQKLYEIAQTILDLHRKARGEITGHDAPIEGELRLAASSIPGEHFLPSLLSAFTKKYPHIQIRATVSDSAAAIEQVERGEVWLGFVGQKVQHTHLVFRVVADDRMVLATPSGHSLSRRRKVTLAQIASYPLVIRQSGSGLRRCFEKSLEKVGMSLADFHIAMELGSNEAVKEAVIRGGGVAVLSALGLQKELKAKQLYASDVSDLDCDRKLYLVQDKRRVLPFPARLFLSFLESDPSSTIGPST